MNNMNNYEQTLKFPSAEDIELLHQRSRKEFEDSICHNREAPAKFLKAWLQGVKVIGWEFFQYNSPLNNSSAPPVKSIEDVTNKWQVCPNSEYIIGNIGVIPNYHAILLASMCSFYNSNWGGELMRSVGINGLADISARLDTHDSKIIAELLINYNGW